MIKFIFSFLMITVMTLPTLAAEKKGHQNMRYDVYAGGIHALQANLDIDMSAKDKYALSLQSKTYGLLGKLAPWQGTFFSRGWRGEVNKPELHQSTTTWRDEEEIKKYHYKKNGDFVGYSVKDDKNDGSIRETDKNLTDRTSDVLTATLNIMEHVAKEGKCVGSTEIFDGKRRFKLVFKEKQKVELKASRYNIYGGPAVECTVEVQPLAGKWREKPRGWMSIQEQGRERGTMPTVWFAQMTEGQPAIPVKVRVKTDYGTLFMHLTQYQHMNQKLALKDKDM